MKKILKVLGAASVVALAAGCVPYRFENDKETGRMEIGGLLWNLTKTTGKDEDTYVMELLPFIDKEKAGEVMEEVSEAVEEAVEEVAEAVEEVAEEVEEAFAEAAEEPELVVESVDTAEEVTEEPFAETAEEPEVKVEEAAE